MADKKISELDAITGANTAATDVFVVVDTSTGQTKKITREELNNAIEQDVLSSIDIDTINGDFTVNGNMAITGTVDGRDVATDGTKLDGIETGATADQTKSDIDALGIDAATLDGIDSSQFLRSDQSDTLTGNLSFGDNDKAIFGAGSDLQIYHDGSNSYIWDAGTGLLQLRTNGSRIEMVGQNGSEYMARFEQDGAVKLYYDNAQKLATTSTGIDVTGTVTADGLTVDTNTLHVDSTNNRVGIGTSSPDKALTISASDSQVRLYDADGTNQFASFQSDNGTTKITSRNNTSHGTIAFQRYNGTTVAESMRIDSSGRVGIGTTSPAEELTVDGNIQLLGATYTDFSDYWGVDNNSAFFTPYGYLGSNGSFTVSLYSNGYRNSSGGFTYMGINGNTTTASGIDLNPNGLIQFKTGTASATVLPERMRITSTGLVGIGTSSPTQKLTVANGYGIFEGIKVGQNGTDIDSTFLGANSLLAFKLNGTERMRIDSSGRVGIGTSSPTSTLHVKAHINSINGGLALESNDGSQKATIDMNDSGVLRFYQNGNARMRLNSDGDFMFAKTTSSYTNTGIEFDYATGRSFFTVAGQYTSIFNRKTNDGIILYFAQDSTLEGSISVSGTTVSYNGGHLARWSQLTDGTKDEAIVKGTVMTNLDQMAVWSHDAVEAQDAVYDEDGNVVTEAVEAKDAYTEDNEQLNCMAVSSVEGDPNVAGVFVNWDNDDDEFNDMNIAMTGDMVIRIAQGTTVARGDLLMSAGDGTAKPQGDDIVRSKTIAKVTSINVSHTYDDGSYLVPCVLMAC